MNQQQVPQNKQDQVSPGEIGSSEDWLLNVETIAAELSKRYTAATGSSWHFYEGCAKASGTLSDEKQKSLFLKVKFGPAKFSKAAKIGAKRAFKVKNVQDCVPMEDYTTMYVLSFVEDERIPGLIKEGKIKPGMSREEAEKLRGKTATVKAGNSGGSKFRLPNGLAIAIRVAGEPTEEQARALRAWLDHARGIDGIEIADRFQADQEEYESQLGEWEKNVLERVFNESKAAISKLGKGSTSKYPKKATQEAIYKALGDAGVATTYEQLMRRMFPRLDAPAYRRSVCRLFHKRCREQPVIALQLVLGLHQPRFDVEVLGVGELRGGDCWRHRRCLAHNIDGVGQDRVAELAEGLLQNLQRPLRVVADVSQRLGERRAHLLADGFALLAGLRLCRDHVEGQRR
jgi:hypothetical protein